MSAQTQAVPVLRSVVRVINSKFRINTKEQGDNYRLHGEEMETHWVIQDDQLQLEVGRGPEENRVGGS